jgi:hypothetical protein
VGGVFQFAASSGRVTDARALIVIRRQLGYGNLGITSIYLQGSDNAEIIETVHLPSRPDDPGQRVAAALVDSRAQPSAARALR